MRFSRDAIALARQLRNTLPLEGVRGREMRKQDTGYDFHRYRQLLAEAIDETKRLAFIDLLIEERARERLQALHASDRAAMTATTIAKVLGTSRS